MGISNLAVDTSGTATWTNKPPYGYEIVLMYRAHGTVPWVAVGLAKDSVSYKVPLTDGVTYDFRIVPDLGDLNGSVTVPGIPTVITYPEITLFPDELVFP